MIDEPYENALNPEEMDPSVPTDLLELHTVLEEEGVTPEALKEQFGGE